MDLLSIILYVAVLLPFGLLIILQIKRPRLAYKMSIHRIKKRIGLPGTILNSPASTSKNALGKLRQRLTLYVLQAGIAEEKVNNIFICGLTLAVLSIVLLLAPVKLSPTVQLVTILLPFIVPVFLMVKRVRRRQLFVRQLPDAIEAMVRSLSAGSGINQAMMMISNDFPQPISDEFRKISNKIQLGVPFNDVMDDFRSQLSIAEVHYLAIALIIQRETGGHIIKLLEQLAGLMRRRVAFSDKVKTVTAESRFTAFVIGGLPLAFIGYRYFFDRQSMDFFLHDPTGLLISKGSLALIITGMIILKHMTRITF